MASSGPKFTSINDLEDDHRTTTDAKCSLTPKYTGTAESMSEPYLKNSSDPPDSSIVDLTSEERQVSRPAELAHGKYRYIPGQGSDRGQHQARTMATSPTDHVSFRSQKRNSLNVSQDEDQTVMPAKKAKSIIVAEPHALGPPSLPQSPTADPKCTPPKWYTDLGRDTTRAKNSSNADTLLSRLRDKIQKCKDLQTDLNYPAVTALFGEVRELVHTLAFEPVTARLLRNNRMLHETGLPGIFHSHYTSGVPWPWDIRADAEELYNKWYQCVFEPDLLRGIIPGKRNTAHKSATESSYDRLDPNYDTAFARYHGKGALLNGQWWPSHITLLRDGAHGAHQAGICGKEGEGAYSCIMSGGLDSEGKPYPDEDHGNTVWYCGTDGKDSKISDGTQRMIESVTSFHPVRLIRSHKAHSSWAPEIGLRYDGLYNVVAMENLDGPTSDRQRHRFKLVRRANQPPIRGGSGPEKRPTKQEIEAFNRDKRLMRVN